AGPLLEVDLQKFLAEFRMTDSHFIAQTNNALVEPETGFKAYRQEVQAVWKAELDFLPTARDRVSQPEIWDEESHDDCHEENENRPTRHKHGHQQSQNRRKSKSQPEKHVSVRRFVISSQRQPMNEVGIGLRRKQSTNQCERPRQVVDVQGRTPERNVVSNSASSGHLF